MCLVLLALVGEGILFCPLLGKNKVQTSPIVPVTATAGLFNNCWKVPLKESYVEWNVGRRLEAGVGSCRVPSYFDTHVNPSHYICLLHKHVENK